MVDEEIKFPRIVNLKNAGIYYKEDGPNAVFINLVEFEDNIRLVITIDQSYLGNEFSACTYGKLIDSIPLVEALKQAEGFAE